MWFPLMIKYFDESPFARNKAVSGEEALIAHCARRQELELHICKEVFPEKVTVLKSKSYEDREFVGRF